MRLSAAGEAGRLGEMIPGGLMLGYSVLVRVWNQFCYALKYFVGYLDDIFYEIFREIFPSTEGAKYFIKYFANPFAVYRRSGYLFQTQRKVCRYQIVH